MRPAQTHGVDGTLIAPGFPRGKAPARLFILQLRKEAVVTGEHAVIRSIDTDDAPFLMRLYAGRRPRASLLNQLNEFQIPTTAEVIQLLAGSGSARSIAFNVIEHISGEVRGFCALRTVAEELFPGRFDIMLFDEGDFATPLAQEAGRYLLEEAFLRKGLKRIVAQCLDSETALRAFLEGFGFTSRGVQREVLYSAGRWLSMESLALSLEDATARLTV